MSSTSSLAASLAARSSGRRAAARPRCGWRPIDANRMPTSANRRSNADASPGQRAPSTRFQKSSGSSGSWRSSASPRSRSSRPGIAWTSASCRSRRRSVSLSIGVSHDGPIRNRPGRGNVDVPERPTPHAPLPGGSHVPLATRPSDDCRPGPRRVRQRRHDRDRERRAAGTSRQRARVGSRSIGRQSGCRRMRAPGRPARSRRR